MLDQEIRKTGIGGSEVSAILGLSDYSSPYKVWLAKTGREDSSVDNKFTRAGTILESAVAEFFEKETQYRIIKSSANQKTYRHPEYEFVVGTPDRVYFKQQSVGRGILECKTTQYMLDDVPESWFIQLQWYLGIVGSKFGSVAWLERGVDFKYKEYEFDKDFFQFLIDGVSKFWYENVVKDVPPEPINSADIERIFNRHTEGKVIMSTPELESVHSELISVRDSIKVLEQREKELTETVKLVMADSEAVMSGTKPLFTWRSAKPSQQFDRDRFKSEYPAIYENYLHEVPGSRRFLIKGA